MAKTKIPIGSYLVNLQTGQRIDKTSKNVSKLVHMRGNSAEPKIWAWDTDSVPETSPSVAPNLLKIERAKVAEKDAEIERLQKMLAAKEKGEKPKAATKPKEEKPQAEIPENVLEDFAKPKRTRTRKPKTEEESND